jgi:hypothetical protein
LLPVNYIIFLGFEIFGYVVDNWRICEFFCSGRLFQQCLSFTLTLEICVLPLYMVTDRPEAFLGTMMLGDGHYFEEQSYTGEF